MAVEYSLLTWAGLGTTVTFTDVGDVVNMTAHGAPNGHAFRFTTTGALPTGLTAGTTYYLRAGADANKFLVYPTQADAIAGTNQVTFSGTGSGTHMVVGEYWSALGTEARARYGDPGNEFVYRSMSLWSAAASARADLRTSAVLEVQGKWTDIGTALVQPGGGYYSTLVTCRINGGIDQDSFHGGVIGGGYRRVCTAGSAFRTDGSGNIVEGLEFISQSGHGILPIGNGSIIRFCLVSGSLSGIGNYSSNHIFHNNVIYNCTTAGISLANNASRWLIYNNTIIGCGTAIAPATASNAAYIVNNVCIGNSINWGTAPASGYYANNAGLSTDTIWDTSGTSSVAITDADFKNYVVPAKATSDFRPAGDSAAHTSSSALTDAGYQVFDTMESLDIVQSVRPSYKNGSATGWDIGAYEFDWGYGPAPSSVTISITGMVSGSEIAIYKASDMSEILAPQSTTGSYSGTYTYTGDVSIIVRVRKGTAATRYLPYEYAGTITSTGFQLVVSQIPDTIAQ